MIIGAYVMGLTLAATDLGLVIQENTRRLRELLVPLFFATMGMMVNPAVFADPLVLVYGLAYCAMAILGKVVGSGGPSLLMGFNWKGALRIGFGMVPRGEVALTIAGIGISQGFLEQKLLGVVIMMSLVSILVSTLGSRFAFGLPQGRPGPG
jgi:Kef-type K+ transport system membrane component KefB